MIKKVVMCDRYSVFPQWVAAIAGKLGQSTEKGFVLEDANIQVFEKKPKEPKPSEVVA